jgi:ABC-2 type transport system permease protein
MNRAHSYLRLFIVFMRLGLLGELQYRANFFVQLFDSAVKIGSALIGLAIVFSHTDKLGGWTLSELYALTGVFFIVGGFVNMIVEPSMLRLMEDVRKGTLDYTLLKPEDAQLLVSMREIEIWKLADIVLGAGILSVALWQMSQHIDARRAALFGVTLLSGGAIVYSFWLMLATCSFWFVKVTNILHIFESVYQAGRWPLGLYPPWLRNALTFVVPVAVAVTIPAEALVARLSVQTAALVAGCAVLALLLSRWFWTIGVRNYSGASA